MQVRKNKNGTVSYRVIYRTSPHGPRRVETFYDRDEALDFERDVRRARRQARMPGLEKGKLTMGDFVHLHWWPEHVQVELAERTARDYAKHWDRYTDPHLGGIELRDFTPGLLAGWRAELERQGVNKTTVRQAMVMVQGILSWARSHGHIDHNPMQAVRKPSQVRKRAVLCFSPDEVERLRRYFLDRGDIRDLAIASLCCYAGQRPQNTLALEWPYVRDRTIIWEQKNIRGRIVPGHKVASKGPHTTTTLSVLREDLELWRREQGVRPLHGRQLLFTRKDGSPFGTSTWSNWTQRNWRRALEACELEHRPPYDSRHAYASLRLWEGWSIVEVAAELGNSPMEVARTYAHVIAELKEGPRSSAEKATREARNRVAQSVSGTSLAPGGAIHGA